MALNQWMSLGGCHVAGCQHGRASLAGCHWLNGRVVLAKEYIYIYYIVKPNLALALWSPSIGLGGDLKSPSNKKIIAGL